MSRVLLLLVVLPAVAQARPWQGLVPGTATEKDVVAKFGEPTGRANKDGRVVLAYTGAQAIKGTKATQLEVDAKTKTVLRMDVFPAASLDKDAIESAYGGRCTGKAGETRCYEKKLTERLTFYFVYPDGLAVFFDDSGRQVVNLTFFAPKR